MSMYTMIRRIRKRNINTKDYLNDGYSDPKWKYGYQDAIRRIVADVGLIEEEYKKHLDIGCADGTFTKEYSKKFPETEGWGVDLSDVVVQEAYTDKENVHFLVADCYALPFEDGEFDLVHSAELLEHLEYPDKAIREWSRVLKEGGHLIISTINKDASRFVEHLWIWDMDGFLGLFGDWKIVGLQPTFFNKSIVRIELVKK